MGARFDRASSQSVTLASPLTLTRPFSWGCWFKILGSANTERCITGFTDGTIAFSAHIATGGSLVQNYWNGSATSAASTLSTVSSGGWNYMVSRHVGNASRRISLINDNGISNGSNTTSITSTLTTINIGMLMSGRENYFDGLIAEWWFATGDLYAVGGNTDSDLLWRLAYLGPFSAEPVASNLIEYRSFRQGIGSNQDVAGEVFQRGSPRAWVTSGSPRIGEHPPLDPGYVRPNQNRRILAV